MRNALTALAAVLACLWSFAGAARVETLRVCLDPNNLPFSDRAGSGFEDKLARLLADDLGRRVERVYQPLRRAFVRNTLSRGSCDVLMGVPREYERVLTTAPYYRTSYVFVMRSELTPAIRSFDDPRLRNLRVGVPVIGDDYTNPPPVHALSRRGIVDNVIGFSVFGDYRKPSPPLALVEAVRDGVLDVAVAWGPPAGYVAKRAAGKIRIVPAAPEGRGMERLTYEISLGVRKSDEELKVQLDTVLVRQRVHIKELLDEYGVPQR